MTSNGTPRFIERYGRVIYANGPQSPKNPFNVKNWANAGCYPTLGALSLAQWRWEFLRRNSRYREFWKHTQQLIHKGWETEPELDYHVGTFFLNKLVDPALEACDGEPHFFAYRYHMASWLPSPPTGDDFADFEELANSSAEKPRWSFSPEIPLQNFIEEAPWDEEILLVAIRAHKPLKPQFSAISQMVEARVGSSAERGDYTETRLRPEKYRDYLRVLDAKDEAGPFSPSWRDIAEKFSEERAGMTVDRVRGLHKQAVATQLALAATPFVA